MVGGWAPGSSALTSLSATEREVLRKVACGFEFTADSEITAQSVLTIAGRLPEKVQLVEPYCNAVPTGWHWGRQVTTGSG